MADPDCVVPNACHLLLLALPLLLLQLLALPLSLLLLLQVLAVPLSLLLLLSSVQR